MATIGRPALQMAFLDRSYKNTCDHYSQVASIARFDCILSHSGPSFLFLLVIFHSILSRQSSLCVGWFVLLLLRKLFFSRLMLCEVVYPVYVWLFMERQEIQMDVLRIDLYFGGDSDYF